MNKHKRLMISIIALTAVHLLICIFSTKLYAYFNMAGSLGSFRIGLILFRIIFAVYIALCGYFALRENLTKYLPLYLLAFLFNLILPYLFAI